MKEQASDKCRYLMLNLVYGKAHEKPIKNPLIRHALPDLDLSKGINSLDPWIVSATLFMARKRLGILRPEAVVKRWEHRPDLWDQTCTDQAILFLAGFPPGVLTEIQTSNIDIQDKLEMLTKAQFKGEGQVQLLAFWRDNIELTKSDYLKPLPCQGITLLAHPQSDLKRSKGEMIANEGSHSVPRPLKSSRCQKGVSKLKSGNYTITYTAERVHAKTALFTCQPRQMTRIIICLSGEV